jgi:alpha-beta hydrolase superfamily lysophospholipase
MKEILTCLLAMMLQVTFNSSVAAHQLQYEENGVLENVLSMPIYHWSENNREPRGIVIAIHGVAMHGRCYGALAKQLAAMGFDVYSTDLRGYGRNPDPRHTYCDLSDAANCKHRMNYRKSLGSSMAIRMAALYPELTDGLILSAPAIRYRSLIDTKTLTKAIVMTAFPAAQCDMSPFVDRYSATDPVLAEQLNADPLMRRHLSGIQVVQSCFTVHKTLGFVKSIAQTTPVLVLQGSEDRCVKAGGIALLIANLKSSDSTVRWFHNRGHILLETDTVRPDTMQTVCGWLYEHAESAAAAEAELSVTARRYDSHSGTIPK